MIFSVSTIALTFAAAFLPVLHEAAPFVMVFIPAVTALLITAWSEGRTGVRSVLGKLVQWRIPLKWVVIGLALAFLMRLTISFIALGSGPISTIQLRPGGPASYVLLAVVFFVFAIPEELGWRGYALPKLLQRFSPLAASLIAGVLWGLLHLALHLPGMMSAGLPAVPTLLQLISLSVLITWLYIHTGGNILLTSLFHGAQSFFIIVNYGIPPVPLTWLMAGVYLAFALVIVIAARPILAMKPA
jgi:membrane protease YdiL (CAAX protease family)